MEGWLERLVKWLLGPDLPDETHPGHLWPRWIFLRALGMIYFSAFYSLLFQIRGMIGPTGILPAGDYLQAVAASLHGWRFFYIPSLFWLGSSDRALMIVTWLGVVASLMVFLNIWPRAGLLISFVCFLAFVTVARDFASYQSDYMLPEAGFIAMFFAPPGLRPGLGRSHPSSRASLFLLRWEWLRIYFESGLAKMLSGDYSWRHFTAMDDYYQNAPLPTWIGWYVGHFPHWFHASAVFYTLAIELALVFMVFLPRPFKIAIFWIVAPFEVSIILTGNYAFLNYIVFFIGYLLLDDRHIEWIVPARIRGVFDRGSREVGPVDSLQPSVHLSDWQRFFRLTKMVVAGVSFTFVFYATTVWLVWRIVPSTLLWQRPARIAELYHVATLYGLFANMTHERREVEFQGSMDGKTWTPYPFRYKPQDIYKAPRIYAPYQPRFEWNLWFASLGEWTEYQFVVSTQECLLKNDKDVLQLFASNPFFSVPPMQVRTVVYQYWFTDMKTKRETGAWWRRELLGDYSPPLERAPDGRIFILDMDTAAPIGP
jgi:lipase maturation factor 1